MPILGIMQILMEVLAAAPSALSSVEEAMNAFHQGGSNSQKVAEVANAAQSIATVATNLVLANASQVNTAPPANPAA